MSNTWQPVATPRPRPTAARNRAWIRPLFVGLEQLVQARRADGCGRTQIRNALVYYLMGFIGTERWSIRPVDADRLRVTIWVPDPDLRQEREWAATL